jgi:hypothetical protein
MQRLITPAKPHRVLKSGAILVRQWRGHTYTVPVREDGFV